MTVFRKTIGFVFAMVLAVLCGSARAEGVGDPLVSGTLEEELQVSVTNVTFLQRYPWKGLVDVYCDVLCSDPTTNFTLSVSGRDSVTGRTLSGKHVWLASDETQTNAIRVTSGSHHLVWDAAADNANVVLDNVKVTVGASLGWRRGGGGISAASDVRVYTTGNDYFLGNEYIESAFNSYGVIGSTTYAPTSGEIVFHPTSYY